MALKKEMDKTIGKIDQSQLKKSNNSVNVYDEAQDTPKDFAKKGLDRPSDVPINVSSEPTVYSEMHRYSSEIKINENELRKNKQKNA